MNLDLFKIPSTTLVSECYTIRDLALKVPEGGNIVEIGTGAGRVTMVLAMAVAGKGIKVHSVDDYSQMDKYGEYGEWHHLTAAENSVTFNVNEHVQFHIASSVDAAYSFPDEPFIDLLYLDGAHRYKDVVNEIEAWWPLVKHGGVIAGHDFDVNCSDGRHVIKAIFDTLMTNPDKHMQVVGRVWAVER